MWEPGADGTPGSRHMVHLDLQNIPLSKQLFKTQIEIEDITWSPQYNLPATSTNKCTSLSLQEVELDGWLLILPIILKTRTI